MFQHVEQKKLFVFARSGQKLYKTNMLKENQIYRQDITENPMWAVDIAPHFSAPQELQEQRVSQKVEW